MIHLGFVFEKTQDTKRSMRSVLHALNPQLQWVRFQYATDEEGWNWVEQEGPMSEEGSLLTHYFGSASLVLPAHHGMASLPVRLSVEKEETCYGFLFRFPNEYLADRSLDQREDVFMDEMRRVADSSNAVYAFCDDDAEIEYALTDRRRINQGYAIVYWSKQQIHVKNAWKIDGLTAR